MQTSIQVYILSPIFFFSFFSKDDPMNIRVGYTSQTLPYYSVRGSYPEGVAANALSKL